MKKKNSYLKLIARYTKGLRISIFITSLFILFESAANVISGGLVGNFYGLAIDGDFDGAIKSLIIYFVFVMITSLIYYIAFYKLSRLETLITSKIAKDTYDKATKLPAYAYEDMSSGEVINRITSDTEEIAGNFEGILYLGTDIITCVALWIYFLFKSYIVAFFVLFFVLLYAVIVKRFASSLESIHKKRKKHNDLLVSDANESIRGLRDIRTLGIINNLYKRTKEIIANLELVSEEEIALNRTYQIITEVIKLFIEVGTIILCGVLTYMGYLSISFLIAMTYYIYRFVYVVDEINDFIESYTQIKVSMGRVTEILDNTLYEDIYYGNIELFDVQGIIEFKNVSFGYPKEENILNNFNARFDQNKKIAIVGSSGNGKSTLFNLITRIFDVREGSITLDGIDIKEICDKSLRNSISIIRQEPFLFNMSIMDNFKLVDENITLDKLRKYTKMAYIDEYIMSLPKQYDSIVGEGGVNFSGGQKQRIAIARSLMKDTKVILFDEATSALDNESQEYIKKTIDDLKNNHTIIIVAHRLSTIMDADLIYLIKDGKIVDKGTHEYLLKNSEYYQVLYKKGLEKEDID